MAYGDVTIAVARATEAIRAKRVYLAPYPMTDEAAARIAINASDYPALLADRDRLAREAQAHAERVAALEDEVGRLREELRQKEHREVKDALEFAQTQLGHILADYNAKGYDAGDPSYIQPYRDKVTELKRKLAALAPTPAAPKDEAANPGPTVPLEQVVREEFDEWVQDGKPRRTPKVDAERFGPHNYGANGIGECAHECGCWMGGYRSGGPVWPFGPCPKNPKDDVSRVDANADAADDGKPFRTVCRNWRDLTPAEAMALKPGDRVRVTISPDGSAFEGVVRVVANKTLWVRDADGKDWFVCPYDGDIIALAAGTEVG